MAADATERVRGLVEAEPVVLLELAGAIAEHGRLPPDGVTELAGAHAPRLVDVDKLRLRLAVEQMLMGVHIDEALEWLKVTHILYVLFPELAATVDLVQETGRQHKDVWAHTKQVVKQTVRRPLVRWAALLPTSARSHAHVHQRRGALPRAREVGARMFDKIHPRFQFARDERQTIRFLVKHHLRTNQYGDQWTEARSAGSIARWPRMTDLLDLSRADITSKRPGRRRTLLEQISALADRVERLAEADAKLPPLPGGVGNAIMTAFELAPSRLIGDLKRTLEQAIERGELEPRREDAYYVAYLARHALVPGASAEKTAELIAAGGLLEAPAPGDDFEGPHRGVDPEDDSPGVLACGHDPDHDPCVHRDADPDGS